jgi:hypothetical protein
MRRRWPSNGLLSRRRRRALSSKTAMKAAICSWQSFCETISDVIEHTLSGLNVLAKLPQLNETLESIAYGLKLSLCPLNFIVEGYLLIRDEGS